MTRKTIAIDIDDVLADTTERIRQLVNELTGSALSIEDYQEEGEYWGYYEQVWAAHGLSDQVSFSDIDDELHINQSRVPILPSADFAIQELSHKYNIVFITSRNQATEDATREWLQDHFKQESVTVRFTGHRKADDYKSKGQLCHEVGACLLIDDNPGHCASAIEYGMNAVLFGKYGWQVRVPDGAVSCKGWPEVIDYVSTLD